MTPVEPNRFSVFEPRRRPLLLGMLMFASVLVRVISLNADPSPALSWSAGIFSDEGIYAGDARSVVFTGHWAPGDFHSAIITPLFHLIQLGVFKSFGVGLVQARSVSVVLGLATLLLFYESLRSIYDMRTAMIGVTFLGLSVPFVLYNRLALLETPTVFVLTLAYLVWAKRGSPVLMGVLLGTAYVFKPLALLAGPAFLVAVWPERRRLIGLACGLAAVILAYAVTWYLPHHEALARMNHYYAFHQYLPHTEQGIVHNLARGIWTGAGDGVLPYLMRHEPVLAFLAAFSLARIRWSVSQDQFMAIWLVTPLLVFLFVSYTPSRYFVLFWPPLAALAARAVAPQTSAVSLGAVLCFIAVCLVQLVGLWIMRKTTVFDLGRKLPEVVAGKTIVIGQFAPELCLNNRLISIYVQPGLANSGAAGSVKGRSEILVTRSPYWDAWWRRKVPSIVDAKPDKTLILGSHYLIDAYSSR